MDEAQLQARKLELRKFFLVHDAERATESYVDGLLANNDFNKLRALLRLTYRRVPKGWDQLPETGQDAAEVAAEVTSDGHVVGNHSSTGRVTGDPGVIPTFRWNGDVRQASDFTHSTLGLVTGVFGFLLVFGAFFANFAPYWFYYGSGQSIFDTEVPSGGASIWFVNDKYVEDCSVEDEGGIGFRCGALLASRIFAVLAAVGSILCLYVGASSINSTWVHVNGDLGRAVNYSGAPLSICALLSFTLYFGSILHSVADVFHELCPTCESDPYSVSFWFMVALVPLGCLHAYLMSWRIQVFKNLSYAVNYDELVSKTQTFKKVSQVLAGICVITLIAGIVQGALDAVANGQVSTDSGHPHNAPSGLYKTTVGTRIAFGIFGFSVLCLLIVLGAMWANKKLIAGKGTYPGDHAEQVAFGIPIV